MFTTLHETHEFVSSLISMFDWPILHITTARSGGNTLINNTG